MAERLNLTVDDGIGQLMSQLAGGERRRGDWLTDLVKAMHSNAEQAQASSFDQLRLSFVGLLGEVKMIEARLQHVEGQLAAIVSEPSQ
jgi:hypothetical protein